MATYVVTVPLVQVETTARNFVQVAKGGELPSSITTAALDNLRALGFVEKTKAPAAPAKPADDKAPTAPSEPTAVKDILAAVGDDVEKAKAALAAEYEAKGPDARTTLVGPLEAIINAAASGDS